MGLGKMGGHSLQWQVNARRLPALLCSSATSSWSIVHLYTFFNWPVLFSGTMTAFISSATFWIAFSCSALPCWIKYCKNFSLQYSSRTIKSHVQTVQAKTTKCPVVQPIGLQKLVDLWSPAGHNLLGQGSFFIGANTQNWGYPHTLLIIS